ncbi:PAS domain-containing protein [Halanaeroarchaeum sulfurireducens]|nr:PAS domain-containing protein [Halanaeroarchaeum sulfurireducens]
MSSFHRTRWNALLIFFLGFTLSAVNLSHILLEKTLVSTLVGSLLPLTITVGVSAIGVWAWWNNWDATTVTRVAGWLVFGFFWMLIVGVGLVLYAYPFETLPGNFWHLLGTFTSYGSVPALLTAWFDIERRTNERSLRQYKQAIESSKDQLAAVDEDLEYLFANNAYRQYHDIETNGIAGRSLRDALGEEQFASIEGHVSTAMAGRPTQTEVTRDHPSRGERILDVRLFPLEDPDGEVQGVGASMRDVTADREREAAIERESEYRRIMSEANLALVGANDIDDLAPEIADILGASHAFSCAFTYLFGPTESGKFCERDSLLGEDEVASLHTRDYLETVFEAGVLRMDDVTEPPFAHHDPDSQSHPGVAVALEYEGERYGILTVHLPSESEPKGDAVELLETIGNNLAYGLNHYTLEAEHRSFADIVERIDDPVMLQNRDGTFRVINEAMAEFAGMEKEALIGRDETAFMDEGTAQQIGERKERVLETEEPQSYQVTPSFPDGRERTFSTTRYPYYDDGDLDGTIAICRDVTDLKEHQRQLRILDRVLRHNVNNNMNVVLGYAEMIEERADGDIASYAGNIEANSERLLDLADKQRKITDFLSDLPPVETVDVEQTVDRTIDRVRSEYPDAEISWQCPDTLLAGANGALEDAIWELLTNSIIHSNREDPAVSVTASTTGATVTISVVDENEPIPELEREVLTGVNGIDALHHGSGLGLWLAKLIVEHADGRLRFQENEPHGNIVRIELPREE